MSAPHTLTSDGASDIRREAVAAVEKLAEERLALWLDYLATVKERDALCAEVERLRAALEGCHDMLRECAKQFRCTGDTGHGTMADLHADQARAALSQ